MWKQIYGMSLYITFVMVIQYFFADNMWGLDYSNSDPFYHNSETIAPMKALHDAFAVSQPSVLNPYTVPTMGAPTNKGIVYTIIFNTFIWLHLFNEFNCRKVGAKQFNVFHALFQNWLFILVTAIQIVLQFFFVNYGGEMIRTAALTG
jgi:hypothetical protein